MKALIIGALAGALGLTACGSSSSPTRAAAPTTAAATTAAPSTAAPTTTTVAPTTTTAAACPAGQARSRPETPCVAVTTTTPTTAAPKKGTRTNPFDLNKGDVLSSQNWSTLAFIGPQDVDAATIHQANQFNDPPADGQKYVRVSFAGTYAGTDTASGSSTAYQFKLAGDKNKIYERAIVTDSHDLLQTLDDQPDVLPGGTLTGFIYYTVDVDDANLMVLNKGETNQFIVPLVPPA
jgi:hypothetical protein